MSSYAPLILFGHPRNRLGPDVVNCAPGPRPLALSSATTRPRTPAPGLSPFSTATPHLITAAYDVFPEQASSRTGSAYSAILLPGGPHSPEGAEYAAICGRAPAHPRADALLRLRGRPRMAASSAAAAAAAAAATPGRAAQMRFPASLTLPRIPAPAPSMANTPPIPPSPRAVQLRAADHGGGAGGGRARHGHPGQGARPAPPKPPPAASFSCFFVSTSGHVPVRGGDGVVAAPLPQALGRPASLWRLRCPPGSGRAGPDRRRVGGRRRLPLAGCSADTWGREGRVGGR